MRKLADISAFENLQTGAHRSMGLQSDIAVFNEAGMFEMRLQNPKNKEEDAQIQVRVLEDGRWSLNIIGRLAMPDGKMDYFHYVTKGKDWEDNNERLESYLRHRIKVCVGKDILNQPDCPIENKNKFWKTDGAWLINFGLNDVVAGWK